MTTIINSPPQGSDGNSFGMIIGGIVLLVIILVVIFYGIPRWRATKDNSNVNVRVNLPTEQASSSGY